MSHDHPSATRPATVNVFTRTARLLSFYGVKWNRYDFVTILSYLLMLTRGHIGPFPLYEGDGHLGP